MFTGKDIAIAIAAKKDLESFFEDEENFIGTSYSSTEASRDIQMRIRRSLAQEQGFDIPELI